MGAGRRDERRSAAPAADARKADGASWCALLTPTPPHLTGKLACDQAVNDKSTFNSDDRAVLSTSSYWPSSRLSKQGAVRIR